MIAPLRNVQGDHHSSNQQAGARRLVTAVLAALLLALAAVTGSSLSPRSSSALLLLAGGNDRPAGLAVGDGALTWARSASYTKPTRPQPLTFGGSTSESFSEPVLPLWGSFGVPDGTLALGFAIADQHAAASGYSTCRVPTGPPAQASRAV